MAMTPLEGLQEQAAKRPNGLAFIAGDDSWSYRRVAEEAERLAQALLARGVRQGDRVALHMSNRPELVSAYYACLLTGAIAAPLNTRLKTVELRSLLRRLQPVLYLGEAQLYPQVAPIEPETLALSARFVVGKLADDGGQPWQNLFSSAARKSPLPDVDRNAPAILSATAGSTGQSKLVANTPKTMAAKQEGWQHLGINGGQIAVNALSMMHGAGLMTFFACVRFGTPMVLFERFEADAVLDAIAPHRCSWMLGLPYMFAELMMRQKARPRDVSSLRFCASGGDVCPVELQEAFPAAFGIPLYSTWGSTETGLFVHGLRPGPVTRVMPGMEARLVTEHGVPAPHGAVGEMLVRGPSLMIGYWKSPGRIDDPRTDGWFATGDLMRQGEGDELWFVARKKDLIIRGGSNIAPTEVENVLRCHPAVRDVVVVGIPDQVLGQRVVALVQLADGPGPGVIPDILAYTKRQLADYKVPERLEVVAQIPRTALGKVDRASAVALLSDTKAAKCGK
jgi:long-chain acyl-CoA synthetase